MRNITITAARHVTLAVKLCSLPQGSVDAVAIPVFDAPWSIQYPVIHYGGATQTDQLSFEQGELLACVTTGMVGTVSHAYVTRAENVPLTATVTGDTVRVDIPFGRTYNPALPWWSLSNPCSNPSLYKYVVTSQSGTNFGTIIGGEIRLAFQQATSTASTATDTSVAVCGVTVTQTRVTL